RADDGFWGRSGNLVLVLSVTGCDLQRTKWRSRRRRQNGVSRAALPPVAKHARARVSGRMRGEVAVELREQRHAVGKPKLRTGGGERGIFRQRRAVDDEVCARERLEHRQ